MISPKRVAQVVIGILGAVVVGEIALRALGVSFPAWVSPDPITAFSRRPKIRGWHNGEARVFHEVNSQGFNDVEWQVEKKPGTFRIAILGDSFTEALDVERKENFSSRIARDLASCPAFRDKKVETLNFGIGGYGTAQELLTLRHKVWAYEPDMVVLAMFGGNDVRNNHRGLQREVLYPYFVEKAGKLILDDSFLSTPDYKRRQSFTWRALQAVSDHSRLLQLVNETKKNLRLMRMKAEEEKSFNKISGEHGLDFMVLAEPKSTEWKEAWQITERMLREMNNEVEEKGAKLLVVGVSVGIQVTPELDKRKETMKQLGVNDLYYVERRLGEFARNSGIEYLPLAQVMADNAEKTGTYFHGGKNAEIGLGHWNQAGHEFAGRMVTEKICSLYNDTKVSLLTN